eukprot:TRINITY_DN1149_c0_g1_i13.p1 TRINITY_DN1149_c0_g1~~TRINITY_DN1149_c0_g1_i13.p1  ORF type:complete len:224 (-),score=4.74 TRINITY_DN1149_c0_g1_i13:82-753(-)
MGISSSNQFKDRQSCDVEIKDDGSYAKEECIIQVPHSGLVGVRRSLSPTRISQEALALIQIDLHLLTSSQNFLFILSQREGVSKDRMKYPAKAYSIICLPSLSPLFPPAQNAPQPSPQHPHRYLHDPRGSLLGKIIDLSVLNRSLLFSSTLALSPSYRYNDLFRNTVLTRNQLLQALVLLSLLRYPCPMTTSDCRHAFQTYTCLLYTSPSPRDGLLSRMPSSA